MAETAGQEADWWGELRLAEGAVARWRIGPLELTVCRGRDEWQVAWRRDPALAESQEWSLDRPESMPEKPDHQERFVVGRTEETIAVRPALPDRPIVSRPRLPFHLLPEREVTLYVGSPIWIRLEAGEPPTTLRELPSHRPSDIWFGENTREGELCYATETRALLHLENLPVLRRSALTPVRIQNRAPSPLHLERLKLPVPLLELYSDPQGRLWTQGVTLTRSEESDMATLDVRAGAPAEASETVLVTGARETSEAGLWTRAFGSLLGLGHSAEEMK